MRYQRDFTIGLKETRDFYQMLVLGRWWKGILGFGVVGGLVAWMYLNWLEEEVSAPAQVLMILLFGLAVMGAVALGIVLSTRVKVRSQLRNSGRGSYVQSVEIDGFGVRVAAGEKKAKVGFDKLLKVRETGKAFYIFLSAAQAWILPKAQMEDSAAESEQLRTIFRTVMESKKLKLKK